MISQTSAVFLHRPTRPPSHFRSSLRPINVGAHHRRNHVQCETQNFASVREDITNRFQVQTETLTEKSLLDHLPPSEINLASRILEIPQYEKISILDANQSPPRSKNQPSIQPIRTNSDTISTLKDNVIPLQALKNSRQLTNVMFSVVRSTNWSRPHLTKSFSRRFSTSSELTQPEDSPPKRFISVRKGYLHVRVPIYPNLMAEKIARTWRWFKPRTADHIWALFSIFAVGTTTLIILATTTVLALILWIVNTLDTGAISN
eukprot:TRINITY_DN3763_c0_g1_i1.p1 TRINITY_DN3763_c0_g1~~TRINITY_DN3763_c0_g1_i1.p1  ORF type:complete len:261 (-),score=34.11 TRINITY_DN3763_c0_g1_i1:55-837(-)